MRLSIYIVHACSYGSRPASSHQGPRDRVADRLALRPAGELGDAAFCCVCTMLQLCIIMLLYTHLNNIILNDNVCCYLCSLLYVCSMHSL